MTTVDDNLHRNFLFIRTYGLENDFRHRLAAREMERRRRKLFFEKKHHPLIFHACRSTKAGLRVHLFLPFFCRYKIILKMAVVMIVVRGTDSLGLSCVQALNNPKKVSSGENRKLNFYKKKTFFSNGWNVQLITTFATQRRQRYSGHFVHSHY